MAVFVNENVADGLAPKARFQAGISDADSFGQPEKGVQFPWPVNKQFTYINSQCWVENYLDSGIVVHRPLPQNPYEADQLGTVNAYDKDFTKSADGVNLNSNGRFYGVVQRMADSRYRFCLRGWSLRVGYLPTFPVLKFVGGQQVVTDDQIPQKVVGPIIVSNNSGIPVYFASWAFWYTLADAPSGTLDPVPNVSEHISASDPLPNGIQLPMTHPDQQARATQPAPNTPAIRQGPGARP